MFSFLKHHTIIFTSYGSPYSHITIALWPIQYNDDTTSVSLLFTWTEFSDLVTKWYPRNCLDLSFLDNVFNITGGHVGAFLDFIQIIVNHKVNNFTLIGVMI
jgi:hypothetical protein